MKGTTSWCFTDVGEKFLFWFWFSAVFLFNLLLLSWQCIAESIAVPRGVCVCVREEKPQPQMDKALWEGILMIFILALAFLAASRIFLRQYWLISSCSSKPTMITGVFP